MLTDYIHVYLYYFKCLILVAFKPQNKINNFKIKTSFLLQRNVVFSNKK